VNELALFAGAGGGILGGKLLGWRTVCAVERDAFAAAVLAQRQNDGCLEAFPVWSDVETFDGKPWRGIVDVISGGFPCTDISCAGKGAGIEGSESGLWREFKRIIGEVRPIRVLVENSPMLTIRGLGTVLGDLAALGYDAEWGVLSAADAIWFECLSRDDLPALDHLRERIWIVATRADAGRNELRQHTAESVGRREDHRVDSAAADSMQDGCRQRRTDGSREETGGGSQRQIAGCDRMPESTDAALGRLAVRWWPSGGGGHAGGVYAAADGRGVRQQAEVNAKVRCPTDGNREAGEPGDVGEAGADDEQQGGAEAGAVDGSGDGDCAGWWAVEPGVGRLVHGLADRVDRCKALGNGQVPAVVRLAWNMLTESAEKQTGRGSYGGD